MDLWIYEHLDKLRIPDFVSFNMHDFSYLKEGTF